MDFDFDDLDGDDADKVKNFNTKFVEALEADDVAKATIVALRGVCPFRSHFLKERAEKLGFLLDPLLEEFQVTFDWIENQNWVLREEDESIMAQFRKIEELFSFGTIGPIELEKGDLVEAGGNSERVGVVFSFTETDGSYVVRFVPEEIVSITPAELRKLGDAERLMYIQKQVIAKMRSPDVMAAVDGLRKTSTGKHFDDTVWEVLSGFVGPVCESFGVDMAWVRERSEALGEVDQQVAQLQKDIDALASLNIGPLAVKRGDCVEISGLESEEERPLNGRRGVLAAWHEEQSVYEVHLVAGEPVYMKPGSLTKLTEVEVMRAIQKQIMEMMAAPEAQMFIDGLRARCVDLVQYSRKVPDLIRDRTMPVYNWFGVTREWQADMIKANSQDRELRGFLKRIETLTSFGKIGPWGLEKGTFYEAYNLSDREERDMNGTAFLVRGWNDAQGGYEVSPLHVIGTTKVLKAENLKAISDKAFGSQEEAAYFQKTLQDVYDSQGVQEMLAGLRAAHPDVREYLTALKPAVLDIQKGVLSGFGFRPDFVGQNHAQRAMARYEADAAFAQWNKSLERFGMQELRFDGRVALVTGGGRGLGRAYATILAARGAMVVVNNRTKEKADEVVAEITARGGIAVPEYSDCTTGADDIIPNVLKHFGKIDIIVANAGVLDDHRFEIMKTEYFTNLLETHVFAHFKVLKAAWPHMMAQKYGRIVIMSSESGINGNWGQSNYGAAKMALTSMGQSLALEGHAHGILCNVVCPVGLTRMTNDLRPMAWRAPESELKATRQPTDKVTAYLCHETCKTTAAIFRAEEGHIQSLRLQADNAFVYFDAEHPNCFESLASQWNEWAKWEQVSYPGKAHQAGILAAGKPPPESPFMGARPQAQKTVEKMRFDDRVAVVTGGGRGLGRAYCLFLAARGAKVVVNNRTREMADKVVAEIKRQGGEAVAEYSDVASNGDAVIAKAMDAFGRVDILICNAGVRQDAAFGDVTFEQFAQGMHTDLIGHVKVMMAAWPQFFMKRFGRIVLVTSEAGLYGNPGQVAYGAAKAPMTAVAQTLAMEGYKYGIYTNCICTEGTTRMNSWTPEDQLERLTQPAAVPVAFLSHESCKASGGIFRVKGGKVQSLRWQSDEAFVDFDPEADEGALESVATDWSDEARFEKVSYPGMAIHRSYR